MFEYAVKTEISNEYFTVLAHGTKRDMLKFAEKFDAHPETIESKITRRKDSKIVHYYVR